MRLATRIISVICVIVYASVACADGIPIAPLEIWQDLVEGDQIALVNMGDNGSVNVRLFISISARSNESHLFHLILPFVDEPTGFQAEELTLESFVKKHIDALRERAKAIHRMRLSARDTIDLWYYSSLALCSPLLTAFASPAEKVWSIKEPNFEMQGGVTPYAVVTTEHTRTEVYRVERQSDIDAIRRRIELPSELLPRLRRYIGKFLYIVSIRTVPMKSNGEAEGYPSRNDILGVSFDVHLWATPRDAKYTFTYPLGTGETWYHPIRFTQVFVTAPANCDFNIRYPILKDARTVPFTNKVFIAPNDKAQQFFTGCDDNGHIACISYWNANPSDDIFIAIGSRRSGLHITANTAKQFAWYSWIVFIIAFIITWCIAISAFAKMMGLDKQGLPLIGAFFNFIGIGIFWMLCNSLFLLNFIPPSQYRWLIWQNNPIRHLTPADTALTITAISVAVVVIATLPSVRKALVKLRNKLYGIITIGLLIAFAIFIPLVRIVAGLLLGAGALMLWMRTSRARYWHCLGFSIVYGCAFAGIAWLLQFTIRSMLNI